MAQQLSKNDGETGRCGVERAALDVITRRICCPWQTDRAYAQNIYLIFMNLLKHVGLCSDIKSMENITIYNNTYYLVMCAFKGQCQRTTKIFCCRIQEQIILAWNFKLAGGFKVPSRFLLDKVKGVGRRENHTCPRLTFKRKFKTKHRAGGSSPLWWTAAVYRCAHNGNYCN